MQSYRDRTVKRSHKGHGYELMIRYVQLFEQGNLTDEYPVRTSILVDGKVITLGTPGFVPDENNPEAGVLRYIDFLENRALESEG